MDSLKKCPDQSILSECPAPDLRFNAETRATHESGLSNVLTLPHSLEVSQAMLHELRLRQIELELQNQALRESMMELRSMQEQYFDLYDLAPVGYCSVADDGFIIQANQTLASLVGRSIESLRNYAFLKLVLPADRDIGYLLQRHLVRVGDTRAIELRMLKQDGSSFWAQLLTRVARLQGETSVLRIALHDITERKRAEDIVCHNQSLLASAEFNRCVIDSVPARIAVLDRLGAIVAVNQPWKQVAMGHGSAVGVTAVRTGVGANYLAICRQAFATTQDPYAQMATQGIEAVLAGHLPIFSMEYPCHHAEGSEWFEMKVMPMGEDIQGVVVAHTDITERKRSNQALVESDARFSQFMDTLPAIAFIKNERGELVYANRHFEKTFLLGNWAGLTSSDLYPPDVAHRLDASDQNALDVGYLVSEISIVRPDGLHAVYQDHKFAIPRHGLPPLLGCIALDISEHKRIEMAYREGQEHLTQAQSIASMGSWRADLSSGDVRWSDEQFRMLGYSPGTVVPSYEAFLQRVVPEDRERVRTAFAQSLLFVGPHQMEYRIQLPDGSQRYVLANGMVEKDSNGHPRFITGTLVDITERMRIADELLAAKHVAEHANRAKSKFLAAASHDLRQPLAALALYVGALQRKADPSLHHLVNKITECCTALSELLNDLLEVSKLEAGVVKPHLEHFSLDEFMQKLLSMHSPVAVNKSLKLRWRNCGQYAYSDPVLMRRIVGNLLSNAIRYTDQGGVLMAYRHHDGRTWLEIWDTGIGIAADKIDFIFEEFSQLDTTLKNPGSGLGLAIMTKTAELLGLKIRVRSREGFGSMFAVELPSGHAVQAIKHRQFNGHRRSLHFAIVENNVHVLDSIVIALQSAGHEVTYALDGKTLLAILDSVPPDIIIADYRLSAQITGYDVIEAARSRFGDTLPALIITGDTDPSLIRKMSQRGIAIQYKPLQLDALLACATEQVERSKT
ncbi:hypothetical protein DIC66_21640 [Rhodoferax lacus]|uniref:histidine kinase n=1 Tax=Rhodoferax lacus TaxID=2184758 RepID=A0A3E1R602_9BURK|nr:PAS domain S-box protein [Rhodoferax lacus]RFO94818.1 hypothetical protein DIC66_21640 [Rhodoferax lacus]